MQLAKLTATVTKEQARAKVRAYRDIERRRRLGDLEEICKRAYYQASQGRPIIDGLRTIIAGGLDDLRRPRLAIAPLTEERVQLKAHHSDWNPANNCVWITTSAHPWRTDIGTVSRDCLALPESVLWDTGETKTMRPWSSRIPQPPPEVANKLRGSVAPYHVLFEAMWEMPEPADPYLLKWLGGSLYAVYDQWDVTPIEAAAMRSVLT